MGDSLIIKTCRDSVCVTCICDRKSKQRTSTTEGVQSSPLPQRPPSTSGRSRRYILLLIRPCTHCFLNGSHTFRSGRSALLPTHGRLPLPVSRTLRDNSRPSTRGTRLRIPAFGLAPSATASCASILPSRGIGTLLPTRGSHASFNWRCSFRRASRSYESRFLRRCGGWFEGGFREGAGVVGFGREHRSSRRRAFAGGCARGFCVCLLSRRSIGGLGAFLWVGKFLRL